MEEPRFVTNQQTYGLADVAGEYARMSHLQPAEEAVLARMIEVLRGGRMLDIGVGGGRTTLHFAKWARAYVGIDYSPLMIENCRERFAAYPDEISFEVCDARDLKRYSDGQFDFVLFSFNGIDYVPPEDRTQVFAEISRVCKPGGYFCFSTHNLQAVPRMLNLRHRLSRNPIRLARNLRDWFQIRYVHNKPSLPADVAAADRLSFNDGAHCFQLRTHYIRPSAQLDEIRDRFADVTVLSPVDGRTVSEGAALEANIDPWLYFLCRNP